MDNFTRFPNEVLEAAILSNFSTLEFTVLLYVARKTYGWGKASDTISVRKMAADTGHDLRAMQRVVAKLAEKNVLVVKSRGPRKTNSIQINSPENWKLTVTQPHTVTQPYTVRQPGVYGQATVCTDGHTAVSTDGQATTHKRNKHTKDTNTKESFSPSGDRTDDERLLQTEHATDDVNDGSWTPAPLDDLDLSDDSLWT